MAKNSIDAYGASGKTNLLFFDPAVLVLVKDKNHPLYDPRVNEALNEEMIASIMLSGVIEPVIIIKDGDTGKVLVADGRQRTQNAVEANTRLVAKGEPAKTIPAIVCKAGMKSAIAQMVLANEGRIEPTATGRAYMAQRLLGAGYNEVETATLLHIKPATLKGHLALLECSSDVRAAVDSGALAPTLAKGMERLTPEEQRTKLATMLTAAEGATGKKTRARKMREATGDVRVRGRRAITSMRDRILAAHPQAKMTLQVIDWILGGDEPDGLKSEPKKERKPKRSKAHGAEASA